MKINLDAKPNYKTDEWIIYDMESNATIAIGANLFYAWVRAADRLASILSKNNISIEEYGIK